MYMGVCLYTSLCLCICVCIYCISIYIGLLHINYVWEYFFSLLSWNAHSQCAKYLLLISKLNTMRGEYAQLCYFLRFWIFWSLRPPCKVYRAGALNTLRRELYCIRNPVVSKDHTGERMGIDLFWRFWFHCFQAHWL